MDQHQAEEVWQEYLKHFFDGLAAPLIAEEESGLPYLFAKPHCATCAYWNPVHRDGLDKIPDPAEQEHIEAGLEGNIPKSIKLDDGSCDGYRDHEFYGWCKRYPPSINNSTWETGRKAPLFLSKNRNAPRIISDYQFPLMSHMNNCGEWRQGDWVKEFIVSNRTPSIHGGKSP